MPTRGRRNKVEDEDDANEVFASESSPSLEQKPPTKRTSTPAASATKAPRYARKVGKAKSNDDDIERDDEEEFTCSHCSKKFKSALGLKYHTGTFAAHIVGCEYQRLLQKFEVLTNRLSHSYRQQSVPDYPRRKEGDAES